MADEPFALSLAEQELPAEADYGAICAAVMDSARGRWFLQEYARRNRHADTERLLAALARIEGVIRDERTARHDTRTALIDMASTIAMACADLAEVKPDPDVSNEAAAPSPASDIAVAAQRLADLAWTLRERGLELATCDEIEAIAKAVLAASALHDPKDRRVHRLAEALQYLARRIDALLGAEAVDSPVAVKGNGTAAAEPTALDKLDFRPDYQRGETAGIVLMKRSAEPVTAPEEPPALPVQEQTARTDFAAETSATKAQQSSGAPAQVLASPHAQTPIAAPSQEPPPAPAHAEPTSPVAVAGPLAALAAMSDEERIALFT